MTTKEEIVDVARETEVEVMSGRGHMPRNPGVLQRLEYVWKQILPQKLQK